MTDKLIEQIKADREAGTPGKWREAKDADEDEGFGWFVNGGGYCRAEIVGPIIHTEANARRIARVPDMEARILADAKVIEAAKELARLFDSCIKEMMYAYHDQFDGVWIESDFEKVESPYREALAAFNEALDSAANAAMKGQDDE